MSTDEEDTSKREIQRKRGDESSVLQSIGRCRCAANSVIMTRRTRPCKSKGKVDRLAGMAGRQACAYGRVREVQQLADCLCSRLSGTIEALCISYSMHEGMYACGALSSTNLIHRGTCLRSPGCKSRYRVRYLGRFPAISPGTDTSLHVAVPAPGFRVQ